MYRGIADRGVRPIAAFVAVATVATFAAARETRAQEGDNRVQPPGPVDLLRQEPFDRLTLVDGTVLTVEPVFPRPLPEIDRVKARQAEARQKNPLKRPEIPEGGNIGLPGEPAKVDPTSLELQLHVIKGAAGDVQDFKVRQTAIDKVEYFEDMLLQESDRLVGTRDFARAFECCLRVRNRNPRWRNLDEHVNRVLFAEGVQALAEGDADRGLRLLRELLERKRDYPGLIDAIGGAYGARVERAIGLGLFARGRRILHELETIAPEAAVVKATRALFVAKATGRLKETEGDHGSARLDALVDALHIWPYLESAQEEYQTAFAAMPTLEVAVIDVANPLGPWVHSPADLRVSRLLYLPILANDDEDARLGKPLDQLAAKIEASDLGRRLLIQVRSGFTWSDESRPVSAIDIVRELVDRTDPHSSRFDARWSDVLDRVELTDGGAIELKLKHAPLKTGALLMGPVGPAHGGIDGRVATSTKERPLVSDGPFQAVAATPERLELRARRGDQSIRRLRELKTRKGQSAVGALKRGEVSLIAHVPPDQVTALAADPEIKIGRYEQPSIHLLALDGRNPVLRSRSFRRALSYAVDRKTLLEEIVLKSPATGASAIADGPFPRGSYADAADVKPLNFEPWLARMLVASARAKLGGGPIKLKFEYPSIPEVERVVVELAAAFRRAGIELELIEQSESKLEAGLRSGRRFDIAYRVVRCREPIQDAGILLCPGYDAPPEADALASAASPEILRLLLELEAAPVWPAAREQAIQIDREARGELPVIPLWQLEDHFAWRDRLVGPPDVAAELYQGIDSWEIKPWFAKDAWVKP